MKTGCRIQQPEVAHKEWVVEQKSVVISVSQADFPLLNFPQSVMIIFKIGALVASVLGLDVSERHQVK